MRILFNRQLEQVGTDIEFMSRLVASAMAKASEALLDADVAAADAVIADDATIDTLERNLDERCVTLLARQQPVATDLRVVVSALRMSSTLERMGDLARHVAEIARLRYPARAFPRELGATFEDMTAAAVRAAGRVQDLLATRDLDVAVAIETDDDHMDALHLAVFGAMTSPRWTGTSQQTVDVTLLSRFLERFGDHAVSIAGRVTFLVTGNFGEDVPA